MAIDTDNPWLRFNPRTRSWEPTDAPDPWCVRARPVLDEITRHWLEDEQEFSERERAADELILHALGVLW
jgi:hypothetical protein